MSSNPNPFAPFVARMDHLVPALEADSLDEAERAELVDLVRRAMYALVNHINAQAQYIQALILDPTPAEPAPDDADTPSLEQPGTPESVARDDL